MSDSSSESEVFDNNLECISLVIERNWREKCEHNEIMIKPNEELILNDKIKYLDLGEYNQKIDKWPLGVLGVSFGYNYNHSIDNLPDSVVYINFGSEYETDFWFSSVCHNFNHDVYYFFSEDYSPYESVFNKKVRKWPKSLKKLLQTKRVFNRSINHIPNTLIYLQLGFYFNRHLDYLPHFLLFIQPTNRSFAK